MRLKKSHVKYDLQKFSFSNRVVNIWNSLPNWVVSANTTNTFKARLDKFWHNQDVVYNNDNNNNNNNNNTSICNARSVSKHTESEAQKHSCKEPEVVASVYMKNLSK